MPGVVRQDIDTQAGHPCPSVPTSHGPQAYVSAGQSKVYADNALIVNKGGSAACGDTVDAVSSKVFAGGKGVHRLGDATVGEGCFVPSTAASGSNKVFSDDQSNAIAAEISNTPIEDNDGDGTPNEFDAFPNDYRRGNETTDTDGDGIPNNQDNDDDNDGVFDGPDKFPYDPTESVDADNDGVGANADADDNDSSVQ